MFPEGVDLEPLLIRLLKGVFAQFDNLTACPTTEWLDESLTQRTPSPEIHQALLTLQKCTVAVGHWQGFRTRP
jgi:hypothetical protein